MGTAYTPGLRVTANTTIRKTRRLPLKGQVMVNVGDHVLPDTVVARTELPGIMQTVRVAERLGIEPSDMTPTLRVQVGDSVQRGQLIAETRSLFGLLKNEIKSPVDGKVGLISPVSGHVGIRNKPSPVEVKAYVRGRVAETIPEEGVVIETIGAFLQGIFGVGGERLGELKMLANSPDEILEANMVTPDLQGKVVVAGANITGEALRKCAEMGVAGVVSGGIVDKDLVDYLGYDIGVAITGQENIPTVVIVTEGFGVMSMAKRTYDLLASLGGRQVSINGATQIRAGVIRPEMIIPSEDQALHGVEEVEGEQTLEMGTKVRIIRSPYFGQLCTITSLPPEPVVIESGASVRVLEAELEDGTRVVVPRANVEIVQ